MGKLKDVLLELDLEHLYDSDGSLADYFSIKQETKEKVKKDVVRVDIQTDKRFIKILPMGDIHLGLRYCNEKHFLKFAKHIEEDPETYTILMGDLAETATKQSIGLSVFDEKYHVGTQKQILSSILHPIAEQGKVLGGVTGNHEMRIQYSTSENPVQDICSALEIPYLGYQGYFKIVINGVPYHLMCIHGTGGGRTKGGKANAALRPNQIANVDVYISGHIHDQILFPDIIHEIDDETDTLIAKKRYYVTSGSFVDYFGGYAEMKGLPPSSIGTPIIYLGSDKHSIHCSM